MERSIFLYWRFSAIQRREKGRGERGGEVGLLRFPSKEMVEAEGFRSTGKDVLKAGLQGVAGKCQRDLLRNENEHKRKPGSRLLRWRKIEE